MGSVPGQLFEPSEIRWVCVDFANTVGWRASDRPIDGVVGYESFLAWGERIGLLLKPVADSLREEAVRRPLKARNAFAVAMELREAVYRILFAIANDLPRDGADVKLLNSRFREAMAHKALVDRGEDIIWSWEGEQTDLNALTWRIAQSTANLITSDYVRRLKSCPGEGCAWLFIDTTRNGSRRWCEMQVCGNRAKVRRHRASVRRET